MYEGYSSRGFRDRLSVAKVYILLRHLKHGHLNVSNTLAHPPTPSVSLSSPSTMPPVAEWRPLSPIQDNWKSIAPAHKGYMSILGALGTIFGFASTIALIVEHSGKLPRWPFTRERWNPKPSSEKKKDKDKDKEDEVSEEDLVADELAEIAGGLKRSLIDADLELLEHALFHDNSMAEFVKRDSNSSTSCDINGVVIDDVEKDPKGFVDKVKNKTSDAVEHGKTGLEEIGEEFKDIVETAEEVGKEIWEDVKEIFGQGDQDATKDNRTEKVISPETKVNTSATRRTRRHFSFC